MDGEISAEKMIVCMKSGSTSVYGSAFSPTAAMTAADSQANSVLLPGIERKHAVSGSNFVPNLWAQQLMSNQGITA